MTCIVLSRAYLTTMDFETAREMALDMPGTAGIDEALDERLCRRFLDRLPNDDRLHWSGMIVQRG